MIPSVTVLWQFERGDQLSWGMTALRANPGAREHSGVYSGNGLTSMTARRPFGTVLVGRNALLREGVARILGSADFQVLASAPDLDELSLVLPSAAQLLIVDVDNDLAAVSAKLESLKQAHPEMRLVIVAGRPEPSAIASAFKAGADGCFIEIATSEAFIKSLELVMLGETMLPSGLLALIFEQQTLLLRGPRNGKKHDNADLQQEPKDGTGERDDHRCANGYNGHDATASVSVPEADGSDAELLSPRQKSILRYLVTRDFNKAIARTTRLAHAAIKAHVKAGLRRIRMHNRAQAAMWVINNGELMPGKDEPLVAAMLPAGSAPT